MRPIRTAVSNFTYLGPTPDIADLPCHREPGHASSVFAPTDEERQQIADGANIEFTCHMDGHPPISLTVTPATERPIPGDRRCTDCRALYTATREVETCGQCGGDLEVLVKPGLN